jgi:hypothetical protein
MRIRSIRPEFWTSEDIAALSWEHRLIFIGLWSYVDDNGVGRDVPKLIMADLFPLEDDTHGALMQVAGALKSLETRGLITRYKVGGKPYLHITTWERHQKINRPSADRYPLPTCDDAVTHTPLTEPSVSPQAENTVGEGEKGRRGEGEKGSNTSGTSSDDAPKPTAIAIPERPDVTRLCAHLADRIEANGAKRPDITKGWLDAARLLLDRDGKTEDEVHRAIDWCQDNEFWRANILSMPKLREKYEQLRLQASRKPGTNHQQATDDLFQRAAVRMGVITGGQQ